MAILLNQSNIQLTGTITGFPDLTSPFSISTWILYSDWPSSTILSMVGLYKIGSSAVQIGSRGSNVLTVWTWGGAILVQLSGSALLSQTDYIHVVYTMDGIGTHRLYVAGQLVASTTNAQVAGIPDTIYINGYPTGGANETGVYSVDDTQYFSRQLSDGEVLTLYNSRGLRDGIYLGIVGRYTFGEGIDGSNVSQIRDFGEFKNHLNVAGTGNPIKYANGVIFNDTRPYQ